MSGSLSELNDSCYVYNLQCKLPLKYQSKLTGNNKEQPKQVRKIPLSQFYVLKVGEN